MAEAWKEGALGDAAAVALSGIDKHIIPGETSVRLCNYLDVYRNRRLTRDMEFERGSATPGEIARFTLRRDDVVMTKDSETPDDIGVPSVVVDDLAGVVCGYHLALLRPSRDLASGFLLHYLQSDAAKRHFLRMANGLTRFGLGSRAISSLPIPLPSPCEQAAIACILDAVDTALERTRAAIEQAREVKRAVLQRFFYEALGETAYADRPRRKLPLGWSLVATELLLSGDPKNGVSPEASSQPPGTPTFSIAAIRNGRVDLNNKDNLKYTRLSEKVASRFGVQRGDVLIVRGNANADLVGRAGMVSVFPVGCIYPDIAKRVVFRTGPEPKVSPGFAVLAWNHAIVHNQVLRRAKTSNGTLKINNRDVKQIVMPVPPEQDQAELVKIVASVEAQIDALTAVGVAQERLKRALMYDLLTGRVRVTSEMKAVAS